VNNVDISNAPAWVPTAAAFIRHLPAGRYRLMNWLSSRRPSQPFRMRMATELGGLSFLCDLRDAIAREVCFTGRYEPQDTALIQSLLASGMTFVDVGANWGYYTLLAAHLVGPLGRVVSFEPDPRLFPVLSENVSYNRLEQVTALQVAAADEAGLLILSGYEEDCENRGLSRLVEQEAGTNGRTFRVQARPIDAMLDELDVETVDLLKMDIEGAEELALRGMLKGLERHRFRRIVLELHPSILAERGRTAQDVMSLLTDAGYCGWHLDFSPAANRRAAYARALNLREFLKPLKDVNTLDAWPHLLWLAPDVELTA
jgi:methyltransferase, FkbM family